MWREPTTSERTKLLVERKLITKAGAILISIVFLLPAGFAIANLIALFSEPSVGGVIRMLVYAAIAAALLYSRKRWKQAMRSDLDERTLRVSEAVIIGMEEFEFTSKDWGMRKSTHYDSAFMINVRLSDSTEEHKVRMSYNYGVSHRIGEEVLIFRDKNKQDEKYMFLM